MHKHSNWRMASALMAGVVAGTALVGSATAQDTAAAGETASRQAPDVDRLVDEALLREIDGWLETEIVRVSVAAQNAKYGDLAQTEIEALDAQWVAEREAADKPLISATLSSPLSIYLLRQQARTLGLYTEIFITDRNGLNVGQSSITSDFWQGDEAKFQNTFPEGVGTVFIDEPEWDDERHIWRVQVNRTIADDSGNAPIGVATIELNLTELERRAGARISF